MLFTIQNLQFLNSFRTETFYCLTSSSSIKEIMVKACVGGRVCWPGICGGKLRTGVSFLRGFFSRSSCWFSAQRPSSSSSFISDFLSTRLSRTSWSVTQTDRLLHSQPPSPYQTPLKQTYTKDLSSVFWLHIYTCYMWMKSGANSSGCSFWRFLTME